MVLEQNVVILTNVQLLYKLQQLLQGKCKVRPKIQSIINKYFNNKYSDK